MATSRYSAVLVAALLLLAPWAVQAQPQGIASTAAAAPAAQPVAPVAQSVAAPAASAASSATAATVVSDWWSRIKAVKEYIAGAFGIIAGAVTAYMFVRSKLLPAVNFLALSLFRESRWPRAAALIELLFMWRAMGFTLKPAHIGRAARLRVEFEILRRLNRAEWRKDRKELTADLVRIIRGYTDIDSSEGLPKPEKIHDCSPLTEAHETMEKYFGELGRFGIDKKNRQFLLQVQMGTGYLAAHYLLYGLLGNHEENWTPVLNSYGEAVLEAQKYHYNRVDKEVFEIQAYQFNCWLLWGPSIAMCHCSYWRNKLQLLQLGYGDECNSVCLAVDDISIYDDVRKLLGASAGGTPAPGVDRLAVHVANLHGTLCWSAQMTTCEAQKGMAQVAGRPVIKLKPEDLLGLRAGAHGGDALSYYSAYLWVMFVLCTGNETDKEQWLELTRSKSTGEDGWRNLLPFFEHGNIADASTLNFLSAALVAKTVKAVQMLLVKESTLRLRYACAFDDPMCEGARVPRKQEQYMRELLREAFAGESRVYIPADAPPAHSPYHAYCSCALPSLTSRYIEHVEKVGEVAKANQAS